MGGGGWTAKHSHLSGAPGNAGLCAVLGWWVGAAAHAPGGQQLLPNAPLPPNRNGPLGLQEGQLASDPRVRESKRTVM